MSLIFQIGLPFLILGVGVADLLEDERSDAPRDSTDRHGGARSLVGTPVDEPFHL